MLKFPARISSKSLALADVPAESAPWNTIGHFALTFDPAEKDPYHLKGADIGKLSADSSLILLRSRLFLKQRAWNHFGREPDEVAMAKIRTIVALIRSKFSDPGTAEEIKR